MIDGKKCKKSQVLKEGQLITHELIRSERRILHKPIEIISEDEDYVVVNKPCSISVHEAGPYYYNSLTQILVHELHFKDILGTLTLTFNSGT